MTHPNIINGAKKSGEISRKKAEARYYDNPNICKNCGGIISIEGRRIADVRNKSFCNSSCSAEYNNKIRERKGKRKSCVVCERDINRRATKYCSWKCSRLDIKNRHMNRSVSKMESGAHVSPKTVRNSILHLRDHVCVVCGLREWLGKPIQLFVDHINGNSEDNRLDNLRLICPNCDAQTPTYMGKNKGNGRHARRERYKQGKSY